MMVAATAGESVNVRRMAALFAVLPVLLLALFLAAAAGGGDPRIVRVPFGAGALGVSLSLRLDGLSILFGVLITAIGALIFVYSGEYFAGRRDAARLFGWLTAFMLAMLGVVTAENLIALFIYWELTSLTSWFLIGADHERAEAREAALHALLITAGGGLALLAGFLMIGSIAGSFDLTVIAAQGETIRAHELYLPALILVALGAFTKSAQWPFHFWLPAAMEAPTPISAYLHSATMVKAGIFVLARLLVPLGGSEEWTLLIGGVGALTMLTGAFLALFASDLKQILAYSTVSALGTLVLLLGIGSPVAVQAAVVFLVAHALYKGALFLVAGSIDHGAGTREVERLGGLRGAMPATAAAAIAGALSLAAVAPALSFAAKEMISGALAGAHPWSDLLEGAVYTTAILLAAIAALIAIGPFFGARRSPADPHDPSRAMWVPAAALAAAGIVFGLFPAPLTRSLLAPAAAAVAAGAAGMELFWWHGFAPLMPVAAVIAAGMVLFLTRPWWLPRARRYAGIGRFGPAAGWRALLAGAVAFAGWQTRRLQSGYLRIYLLVTVLTVVGLVSVAAWAGELRLSFAWEGGVRFHELMVAALVVAGGLVAVVSRSRLGSVAALGVVGYSVAIVYVLFSAPDLAMTQFLIETLTVILFVLVIYRLPRFVQLTSRRVRIRDAIVSSAAGGVIAALIYAATRETPEPALRGFYAENALEHAHGRNIVNVILVDFRALDTLGEIAVVAVAAIGVLALLRIRIRPEQGGDA